MLSYETEQISKKETELVLGEKRNNPWSSEN